MKSISQYLSWISVLVFYQLDEQRYLYKYLVLSFIAQLTVIWQQGHLFQSYDFNQKNTLSVKKRILFLIIDNIINKTVLFSTFLKIYNI